jgi:hypothetical protein
MTDQANRITAEYLVRKVPLDWQTHRGAADLARPADHVTPLRFAAGCAALVLVAFVFGVLI